MATSSKRCEYIWILAQSFHYAWVFFNTNCSYSALILKGSNGVCRRGRVKRTPKNKKQPCDDGVIRLWKRRMKSGWNAAMQPIYQGLCVGPYVACSHGWTLCSFVPKNNLNDIRFWRASSHEPSLAWWRTQPVCECWAVTLLWGHVPVFRRGCLTEHSNKFQGLGVSQQSVGMWINQCFSTSLGTDFNVVIDQCKWDSQVAVLTEYLRHWPSRMAALSFS